MMFLEKIWLIPLFPALGALAQLLFGRKLPDRAVSAVSVGLPGLSFLWAVGCFLALLGQPEHVFASKPLYSWLPAGAFRLASGSGGSLNVDVGFLLDPLAAAFLLGVMLMAVTFGTLDFQEVTAAARSGRFPVGDGVMTAICVLLFIGAIGKSAQIPLYVWLPDAMEGPTPVSALIHAATMVTAGVYMVARSNALFMRAPTALALVAGIGAATAIWAASIGLVQNDIKRVLAYSTVSQLGYMFLACGVGAFAAGIFHLMTHAFFKALLFLGSGSVIHALSGEQDMRKMGGLWSRIPTTAKTMLAATLAISGAPLLSGFFSKDDILWQTFASPYGNKVLWSVALVTAGLTAFYMFRLFFMTFSGPSRVPHEVEHHIHESPPVMTVPLICLAVGAVGAGFVGWPTVLAGSNPFEHFLEPAL